LQEAHPALPVIGSGYTWLRHLMPYAAAAVIKTGGAALVGQGRGAFAYPESVNDILKKDGMDPAKACVTCSACTQIMRDGGRTGCVVRDSEIYGPEYRLARRYALDRLKDEAARCRDCLFATCTRGCPAGVDVPRFIKAFLNDDIEESYRTLRESNVLPEMCAYVCPAEEQCEGRCLESIFCENSLAIRDIQLFVSRAARLKGITGVRIPEKASGKTVSIVGGGPAGIACAVVLLEKGRTVRLYESGETLGGVPRDVVPDCRMGIEEAKAEIDALLEPALEAGHLEVRYESALGSSVTLEDLMEESDAVVIAAGLSDSISLGSAGGVVDALAFLADVKRGGISEIEDRVAVLGGGNTAMDAASAAVELGARDVYLVYRRSFAQMPAWKEEIERYMESGGHILVLTQPVGYETDGDGRLVGLRVARTELGEPDESGRRRPEIVPDSESVLSVDMVIEAIGQSLSGGVRSELEKAGVKLAGNGLIEVDEETHATSVSGLYAVGDAVNGGTTAVQAIAEGMRAARHI
jgi:NADPH-dependent glutamate synthase beta subunit-like oxidoreductase